MRLGVTVLMLTAACGRFGFDGGTVDGGAGDGDTLVFEDAEVIVPGAVDVALGAGGQCPAVAWDGTTFAAVWRIGGFTGAADVMFARYDLAGSLVQGPLTIGAALQNVDCPAIEWVGTHYMVAVPHGALNRRNIDVATIASTGVTTPLTQRVTSSGDSTAPRLAHRNNQVVLTWQDFTGNNRTIHWLPLAPSGVLNGSIAQASGMTSDNGDPRITAHSAGFVIMWATQDRPHLRRVNETGGVVGTEVSLTTVGVQTPVSVAWTGGDLLVVWASPADDGLRVARFDVAGTVVSAPVPYAAPRAELPSVVWDGTGGAVMYHENYGLVQTHLAKLDATGTVTSDIPLIGGDTFAEPSLVWTGTHYVAANHRSTGAFVKIVPAP